jgi:hypothetical protein
MATMSKPIKTTVRRMDEWEEPQQPQLPAVRSNFVAPLPKPVDAPAWLQPSPQELMPQPSVTQVVEVRTSYVDRAKGFLIQTLSLSVVVGILAIIAAVALFGQPFLTFWTFVYFFTGFAAVWLVAYWYDKRTSPDGIAFFQQMTIRQLLYREQDFRQERIRHREGMPPKKGRR